MRMFTSATGVFVVLLALRLNVSCGRIEHIDPVTSLDNELFPNQTATNGDCQPILITPASAPDQSVLLVITNLNKADSFVRIGRDTSSVHRIPANNYSMLTIPRQLTADREYSRDGVCLYSRDQLKVSTINLGSCASFFALPNSVLNTDYEVVTWPPQSSAAQSVISILASVQDTIVRVIFPAGTCQIFYGSLMFFCGDVVTLDMRYLETISFTSNVTLTGTRITSGGPFAVFVGNSNVTIGPSALTDQTISQLFPISTWGTNYTLASIPENNNSGYSLTITSGSGSGNVIIDGGIARSVTPGNGLTVDITDNRPVFIVSSVPIQVIQFVRGAMTAEDSGAPASIVVPSLNQYLSVYSYTNPPGYTHYVMVIIDPSSLTPLGNPTKLLIVDNVPVNGSGWRNISGTTLVTKAILLPNGYSQIKHSGGAVFGAFRYSFNRGNCAFAYPAGAVLSPYTQQTVTPFSFSGASTSSTAQQFVDPTFSFGPLCLVSTSSTSTSLPSTTTPASSLLSSSLSAASSILTDNIVTNTAVTSFPTNSFPSSNPTSFPPAGSISQSLSSLQSVSVTSGAASTSFPFVSSPTYFPSIGTPYRISTSFPVNLLTSQQPTSFPTSGMTVTVSSGLQSSSFTSNSPTWFPTQTTVSLQIVGRAADNIIAADLGVFPNQTVSPASTSPSYQSTKMILPTEPTGVGCASDNLGTNFLIAFLENFQSGSYDLEIYPTTFSGTPNISVVVSDQLGNSTDGLSEEFLLNAGQMYTVDVPGNLELIGIEQAHKAVQIISSEKIGVYGMNSVEGSCDGFLAFPVSALGTVHYTLSYFPPNHKSQIGLIATRNGTVVNVTLRLVTRPVFNLIWNGTMYQNGQTISIPMNQYDTVQLQDNSDLTGTLIVSNFPIAVFSGNDYSAVSKQGENLLNPSHLVEQIPPIDYWGYTFYIVPIPQSAWGIQVKIVGSAPNVNYQMISSNSSAINYTLRNAGDFRVPANFASGVSVKITSALPILVGLFTGSDDVTHPAMMIVPPAELFKSWYTFSTGHSIYSTFNDYMLIVIDWSALAMLQLDGQTVDQTGWANFTGDAMKIGKAIAVSSGVHLIRQMNDIPFGAYVYGYATANCSYAYPAGLCLQSANQTSATTVASTVTSTTAPVTSNFTNDCSCVMLFSSLQPQYNGTYYRDSSLFNGKAYYRRLDCDFVIYRYYSSDWLVGPVLGSNRGALIGLADEHTALADVTSWRAYNSVNGSFTQDAYAYVQCSVPVSTQCATVEFVNVTSCSSVGLYNEVFVLLPNDSYNCRPVFKQPSSSTYLFYRVNATEGCAYWTIGTDRRHTDGGSLRQYENGGLHPVVFNGSWVVYDNMTTSWVNATGIISLCHISSFLLS